MNISNAFLQLIGIILCCTFAASKPAQVLKSRHARSILFENRWPDPDPNIVRFPHQSSCDYYYLVLSAEDIAIKKCPDGELFDYFVHNCVAKELARCWSNHFGKVKHVKHTHLHKKRKHFRCPYAWGKFPDIYDCAKYYQCLNGKAKHKKCAPYEYFDKIAGKCVAEIKAICADEKDVVEHGYKCPRSWGLFPYHKDCSKYYECMERKPILRTCGGNKLFDEKRRKCLNKKHAKCASRDNVDVRVISSRISTELFPSESTLTEAHSDPTEDAIYEVKGVSVNTQISTYIDIKTSPISSSTSEDEATTNISLASSSSYNNAENVASTNNPENKISTKYPENKVSTKYFENEISTKYPEHEISTKYPENKISTKYPENKISTKYPENKISTNNLEISKSTNDAVNDVSTNDAENNASTNNAENSASTSKDEFTASTETASKDEAKIITGNISDASISSFINSENIILPKYSNFFLFDHDKFQLNDD